MESWVWNGLNLILTLQPTPVALPQFKPSKKERKSIFTARERPDSEVKMSENERIKIEV